MRDETTAAEAAQESSPTSPSVEPQSDTTTREDTSEVYNLSLRTADLPCGFRVVGNRIHMDGFGPVCGPLKLLYAGITKSRKRGRERLFCFELEDGQKIFFRAYRKRVMRGGDMLRNFFAKQCGLWITDCVLWRGVDPFAVLINAFPEHYDRLALAYRSDPYGDH